MLGPIPNICPLWWNGNKPSDLLYPTSLEFSQAAILVVNGTYSAWSPAPSERDPDPDRFSLEPCVLMCLANLVHKTLSCVGSSPLHWREKVGQDVQGFKLEGWPQPRKKAWNSVAMPAQKQSPSISVNRIHSKIRDVSSNLSQVAVGPTYGGGGPSSELIVY